MDKLKPTNVVYKYNAAHKLFYLLIFEKIILVVFLNLLSKNVKLKETRPYIYILTH